MATEKQAEYDVIIVGIGGLCAAKTYLELDADARLLILESRATLGGVWAEQNLYEGLKTNNLYGTYEYSDFPMDARYGVKEGQHIPGAVLYRYLTDYAEHFQLTKRLRLRMEVFEVEKLGDGWNLTTSTEDGKDCTLRTRKLIMCCENFDKPVFNHGALRDQAEALAREPNVKDVTVVGASKIGYDAVYLFANDGKKVDWVIRKSGGGAVWMSQPWVKLGPWTVMLEHVACMRFFSWFSPCIWGDYDGFGWIRGFLNRTRIGRWLMDGLWERVRFDVIDTAGYRKEKALEHLEPLESLFWTARVGIHNYASDHHELIRSGKVELHHKDIAHLSPGGTVAFDDGSTRHTDAVVAITGWQLDPAIKYKPDGTDASLGIPSRSYTKSELELWAHRDDEADEGILRQFPRLADPPKRKLPFTQTITPFRMYRGIAPPGLTAEGDRSLAFLKMVHCTSNMVLAETQALWAFAYLNNKLDIDEPDVYRQTSLSSRFEFVYDAISYADMLLSDLGLQKHRKSSWWKERFEGYTIHDYKGLIDEWQATQTVPEAGEKKLL
ncbi:Putative FAD/NAD(P)-binding domain superfamily [Septoria linicola]|uniref:FAD/NAD(P)-binding domain superfamily n=1 Tax=Septoria linicola TaxID=215465 RepID=A0A9Q9AN09_9PEZI|nr:putative FAD/NAD(P)-binding domain superfamily [Septoria linicola]USW51129.1 Putative FAD/NAD(P)-binding domain superfamily [Septoria linicola]